MPQRDVDYEIKMEGTHSFIKGKIKVDSGQSISFIKKKIEQIQEFKENQLLVESPQTDFLEDNIFIIILKEKKLSNYRKYSETSSIYFEEESIIEKNQSYEYIESEPQLPPKIIGKVRECNRFFSCFSSEKTMVLNFQAVRFYSSSQIDEDEASKVINLEQIQEVKPYRKGGNNYFIKIRTLRGNIDLRFMNEAVCKEWLQYFRSVLQYHDYLIERKEYSRNQSFRKFVKTLSQKDNERVVKLEDSTMIPKKGKDYDDLPCGQPSLFRKINKKTLIRLSDFQVTHKIGAGAFSEVFKARCKRDNRIYALKQMNKDQLLYKNQMKYALAELSILRSCQECPFIIQLGYAFQTEDYLYFVIKYSPFGNLKELLSEKKILPYDVAFKIICEVIVAIEHLHSKRILYRDLKPENIMLDAEGHISLIDFGLGIQLDEEAQFAESFVGTPLYLAPQRLEGSGKVNYKADIYGVGCIFYQMLHGNAPYEADNLSSIIYNIKNTKLEIRPDLSELCKFFIESTLEKRMEKRLGDMSSHPLFQSVNWKRVLGKGEKIMSLKQKVQQHMAVKGCNDEDYTEENYPNKKIGDWNFP